MSVMTANSNVANRENGSIKKMIRDTNRLLNRPNLPADMRREQERKLAALQVALIDRQKAEVERDMAVKYRMVKFFERKKALRRLAAAQASGKTEAVAEAQLDLAYILHFPKDRKYISLYPAGEVSQGVLAEREAIRKQIAEKLALLGAEALLAKALTKKALKAQESDEEELDDDESDEDDSEDDDEDSEDDDEDSDDDDDEDSDDEDDSEDDDDSDDGLSYDEDEDSDDDDEDEDSDDDDDDFDSDEEDDEEDSDDEDEDDSEEDDEEEGSEVSDDNSEIEGSEVSDEEESEEEEDAPKSKKLRR